jgi:hypothetical protein
MTELTDLTDRLHRAADGPPPGFGAAEVRRRVDRRRRRGRGAAAALLVLVVVGIALVVAGGTSDQDKGTDRAGAGSSGTDELTASPWIMTAIGGDPVVGLAPTWVSFGTDGSIVGHGVCGPFVASWRWDGQALDVDGLDDRPPGCDRMEGSSLVGTATPLLDLLASDPVPGPSEVMTGGLRLSAGIPDAAPPWIELTPYDDLDPVADGPAITGRWSTDDRTALQIDQETIDGETTCAAPAPWSLGTDGLDVPACVADVLGLSGPGPWEVRSSGPTLWLRDGERLAGLRRDLAAPPSGFDDLVGSRWIVRGVPGVQAFSGIAWLELHADGTVRGHNGVCGIFEGWWTVDEGVLTGRDLRVQEQGTCAPPPIDLQADLGDGLRFARPGDASDQLLLEDAVGQGDDTLPWMLRRLDRIGEAVTAEDLVGRWDGQDEKGWSATFAANGTVEISTTSCRVVRPWSITDGVLSIGDATDDDACPNWIVQLPLPGKIDVRIEGSTLWLSGDGGAVSASRIT